MHPFDYFAPRSLDELCQVLQTNGGKIVAGGTDMLPQMRSRKQTPSTLIDISHIAELRFIRESEEEIILGALTTWSDVLESPLILKHAPSLAQAAALVGAPLTRNRGTLGGNLGNASPAADSLPPLLTLDACVHLISKSGVRLMPLHEFLIGPGKTALNAQECIQQISFKKIAPPFGSAFLKLGARRGMTISIVSAAALLTLDTDGKIKLARIALGAVAPTALRCPKTEAFLVAKEPADNLWQEAAYLVNQEIAPIDDIRGTQAYRRHVATILTHRALETASNSLQE